LALSLNLGTDANVYSAKSGILYKLKRYEKAIFASEQAVRLNPNNAVASDYKGAALRELKRYEEAISAYEQAIRLDPNNAIAHYNKSEVLLSLKRYEEHRGKFTPNQDATVVSFTRDTKREKHFHAPYHSELAVSQANRNERLDRFEEVRTLHRQGLSIRTIAHSLGPRHAQ
jgi:tetratricopeptide (TPR) repeat protein